MLGENHKYQVQLPGLPLAVYRELATHLRQVEGVQTGLIPQHSQEFDYDRSQVESLWIEYSEAADDAARQRVGRILQYYRERYATT
ncbi:hypothetical protein [Argonema antarcticum]|uniref:hypothetical protein n=1 Tax=Argonema antarcticum TaxID=2942763 RepID=UPI0020125759|nr:hypothetical protein [Argonema antarcticum]MCL1470515.1 hypothetical protein [Argonema antarcticum A004/B2]